MTTTDIVEFKPNQIATFGNKLIHVIIDTEERAAEAHAVLQAADKAATFIDFQLTQAIVYLHETGAIDVFEIEAGNKTSSEKLYKIIQVELGILRREFPKGSDTAIYEFTDPSIAGQYTFPADLEKTDPEEYRRRRSRRNALNVRMSKCCKAAAALVKEKVASTDMILEKKDDGTMSAMLLKGPAEVMGKSDRVEIFSKSVNAVEGASVTPTISGLAKLTDKRMKAGTASKAETDGKTRKKENESQSADFVAMVNGTIATVNAKKDGELSDDERRVAENLLNTLAELLGGKVTFPKKAASKAA